MTKIPQLYEMCLPYSDAGETDLNLQEYFNHKCNQKLDYNKVLWGEILGRAPSDFVQHPVAGSPYRQAFPLPEVTFICRLEISMNPTSFSAHPSSC